SPPGSPGRAHHPARAHDAARGASPSALPWSSPRTARSVPPAAQCAVRATHADARAVPRVFPPGPMGPTPAGPRRPHGWRRMPPTPRYSSTALPSFPVRLPPMTTSQRPSALDRARMHAVVRRLFGLGILALGGIIATLTVIVVVQLMSRSHILKERETLLLARDVNTLVLDRQADLRGFLLTLDTTGLVPEIDARAHLDRALASLRIALSDDGQSQTAVDELNGLVARWDAQFVDPAVAAARRGERDPARLDAPSSKALADSARMVSSHLVGRALARLQMRDRGMVAVRWSSCAVLVIELVLLFMIMRRMRVRLLAQADEMFQQQESLELQAAQLEEQQAELEQQMRVMQTLTSELEMSNAELGTALGAADRAGETLRERDLELRRTNAQLGRLFEAAPLAVCAVDAGGVVHRWNPAAERMFGWSAG